MSVSSPSSSSTSRDTPLESRKATLERKIAEIKEECREEEIELSALRWERVDAVSRWYWHDHLLMCNDSQEDPEAILQRHVDLIKIVRIIFPDGEHDLLMQIGLQYKDRQVMYQR